jgi:GNAT superfamily N-acetyltransferase
VELARRAHPDDRSVCTELLTQALTGAAGMRGGATLTGPITAAELLDGWFAPGSAVALFVGEFHRAVVGLLAVTTFVRPGAGGPSGRVECCYVEEPARGVGVGSALMEAAVDWCGAAGCADVDALALPGDRATKQRLEAAGFTARLLTLNRRLR